MNIFICFFFMRNDKTKRKTTINLKKIKYSLCRIQNFADSVWKEDGKNRYFDEDSIMNILYLNQHI